MATSAERAQRALNGSRRQRDIEALRAERVADSLAKVEPSADAESVWAAALERLAGVVSEAGFDLYLSRLRVLGRADDELWLTASRPIVRWAERRYGHLIATTLVADGWIPRFAAEEDLA